MKKTLYTIAIALLTLFGLSSCDSFFDVDLSDQASMEDQFSKYNSARQFLAHCYSFFPYEEKQDAYEGGVIRRSDESLFGFTSSASSSIYWQMRTGDYSAASFNGGRDKGNTWNHYYQGIRQCTNFIENIHYCTEKGVTQETRDYMTAEARFLRAYYYFCLFRTYGPVIIWGNEQAPSDNVDGATFDRNTVDENIEFIVSELDDAIEVLPVKLSEVGGFIDPSVDTGRATKGAAMALKSRVLLYAASPLYNYDGKANGGSYPFMNMTNHFGEKIFPQEYDGKKWEDAAKAAKALIDLAEAGNYSLVAPATKDFRGYAQAYRNVMSSSWNTETIFGWWQKNWEPGNTWLGVGGFLPYLLPAKFGFQTSYGGWMQPSLKLADAYPMWESGRYPVTGYAKDGDGLDLSAPIIDEQSKYKAEGFSAFKAEHLSWTPAEVKAHNSTIGRDPRFYVTLVPNGHYWPCKSMNKVLTMYQDKSATSPWQAGTSVNYVGYVYARTIPEDVAFTDQTHYTGVRYVYPAFRLAEIYLNYAEALNEMPDRDGATACEYIDKVRGRVGLPKITVSYPGIESDQELLRWVIQQERMCEFAWEGGHRDYDARRWRIAKEQYPCGNWTLHLSADNYEDSYERVNTDHPYSNKPAVFGDKEYFFPLSSNSIAEMVNFTQNYGF